MEAYNYNPTKNGVESAKEIPDYDDSQTKEQDIDSFKKDVSSKLGVKAEEVQIISSKFGIKAKVNGSFDEVNIKFKDNLDLSRIAKYSASSSTAVLVNFGDDKNERVIKIANYTNSLTKEAQIQLFKDDIAREMKTEIKNIEVFVVDDKIVARKRNSAENTIVEFSDPVDGQKFMDYAKETVSKRLKDFGIKRQEGLVTVGGSTNTIDPKAGTNLTQSVSYSAFLDKEGTHRLSINSETNFGVNGQFKKENIKNFSVAYQNLDLPFVGDFGEVRLSYGNGKFGVDGKSDAIELQADRISKKFINDLKQGDGKAIAITAGAVAGVGAGLIIAKILSQKPKILILTSRGYSVRWPMKAENIKQNLQKKLQDWAGK
ncbi:hypothetical protein EON78_04120 [bacterium]|nr:MAG: hypothetical protein EON78_04120 [bacterium]